MLGRTTAATGAIEEISAGATLSLAAGALGVTKVPNAITFDASGGAASWELAFEPARAVHLLAGQYMELTIPHRKAGFRGSRRYFSIASAPGDEQLTFAITVPSKSMASVSGSKTMFSTTVPKVWVVA